MQASTLTPCVSFCKRRHQPNCICAGPTMSPHGSQPCANMPRSCCIPDDMEVVHTQETWKALEDCVDKGLVRSIGIANFSPQKLDKWFSDVRIYPQVLQVRAAAPRYGLLTFYLVDTYLALVLHLLYEKCVFLSYQMICQERCILLLWLCWCKVCCQCSRLSRLLV